MGGVCCNQNGGHPVQAKRDMLVYCTGDIRDLYSFDELIGEGAFGSVFKARRRQQGEDGGSTSRSRSGARAIKVLNNNDEGMELLHHEIDMIAELDHPNICKLFEAFEDNTQTYLVMELCEGGDLFDALLNASRFSEKQAAHVLRQVIQSVRYLHEKQIAHRDIKGENYLLQASSSIDDAIVKLVDFGTARHFDAAKGMTTALGSPIYMAPEVLNKPTYSEKCDLWSCGCMLFIMLAGYAPFHGKTESETLKMVRSAPLDFRADYWNKVSKEAVDLVQSLIQRDIKKRLTAAQALSHPWMQSTKQSGENLCQSRLQQRLGAFVSHNKFKKVVLELVARQIDESSIGELRQAFLQIDKDLSGFVSHEELLEVLGSSESSKTLISALDADGDGLIDYREFLMATIDRNYYRQEGVLKDVFRIFDKSGKGHIDASDIERVITSGGLKVSSNQADVESMMEEIGKRRTDSISFEEFVSSIDPHSAGLSRKTRSSMVQLSSKEFQDAAVADTGSSPTTVDRPPDGLGDLPQFGSKTSMMGNQLSTGKSSLFRKSSAKAHEWTEGPGQSFQKRKSTKIRSSRNFDAKAR
mmetsp:Transcript_87708/g.183365  ORF Transcript_87708/g.183365 Transcript_87708/m.183365 type:complete len:583 (-) Transcript_87708:334-2082(-)